MSRQHTIKVRLSSTEKNRLDTVAVALGLSRSSTLRFLIKCADRFQAEANEDSRARASAKTP